MPPLENVGHGHDTASAGVGADQQRRWEASITTSTAQSTRRQLLDDALRIGATLGSARVGAGAVMCGCAICRPGSASALASLKEPPKEQMEKYDVYRDKLQDAAFACGMNSGMVEYERTVSQTIVEKGDVGYPHRAHRTSPHQHRRQHTPYSRLT